jgi:uncharacterized protein (TIGR03435 family)
MVIDRIGVAGVYNFAIHWRPNESQFEKYTTSGPAPEDSNDDRPDLSLALREQLGIRLESIRAPVEVLVIDRIEKPSDN